MIHKEAEYGDIKGVTVLELGTGDVAIVTSNPDPDWAIHIGIKSIENSPYQVGQKIGTEYKHMADFKPEIVFIFKNPESLQVLADAVSHGMANFLYNSEFSNLPSFQKKEAVNHPEHYNEYSVEVIDMMERIWGFEKAQIFCELNAFKYRMRAGKKGPLEEDLKKEAWYLKRRIEIGDTPSKQ